MTGLKSKAPQQNLPSIFPVYLFYLREMCVRFYVNNIEGKITECWSMKRAFFLNFGSEEGKITRSRLVERQKYSLLIGLTHHFDIELVSSF